MSRWIRRAVERMTGYVPGEQRSGPDVLKLNTNENPYPPSPRVIEAIRRFSVASLRLYPDPLSRELRETIAQVHGVSSDHVFVGNGSDEILRLITLAFVEDNGAIARFHPSYTLYDVLAQCRGVPLRRVALGPDFGWRSPPPRLRASLFFLTSPNSPTGRLYPDEAVTAFCDRFDGVVVLDEAYAEFASRNGLALARTRPNVLVVRTLSKAYALAGARLGYAVGPTALIAALDKIKDSYNINRMTQAAARAALEDQAYLQRTVARIRRTRERLSEELRALAFEVVPSEANFLWAAPTRITARALTEALRARDILIRYNPEEWHPNYVRITVGTDAQIRRLVAAIREIQEQRRCD